MPLYEDDFKSVLKGLASHQKDLQPTQKELDDEAKRKRQAELMKTTQAAATADANKPGLFGRVASGVGNFVKDAAISVKNDAETAGKGVYHAVAGDIAAHDNANISQDKLKKSQEFNIKLQGMVGDAWGDPSNPKWNDPAVKKAIADHNNEMAQFDKTNANRVASNQAETARGQAVDAKKTALASASTFLNVATLGEGAAVKAGAEQAGKDLVEQGAKQAGKGLLRTTARGAAEGATFGAASGAASAGANGENIAHGAVSGAEMGAAFGGVSTAAGKLFKDAKAAKAAGADHTAIATHETPPAQLADAVQAGDFTEEEARKILENAQSGRKAEFDNLMAQRKFENSTAPESGAQALLPATADGTPAARPLSEIDAELQDLQTNGIVNATPAESKAKFDALQKERATAVANEAEKGFTMRQQDQQAFDSNGLPNTPAEAKTALDNLDANPPETAMTQDAPVSSATEIFAHNNLPTEIKNAATQILDDKGAAENVLKGLMTPEKKAQAHAQMDQAYKDREAQIADMPAPRQEVEMQKLDEQYQNDLQDLEDTAAQHAPEVQKYQAIVDHLDTKEQQLVAHTNHLMATVPDAFKTVDPVELAAQRAPLEQNLKDAERFHNSDAIVADVAESPDPVLHVERDPNVREAYRSEIAKDTTHLSPDVKDVSGVRGAVLDFLSPSQNLEAMGQRDLHTGIIKAESEVNIRNREDVKAISEIATALKGNDGLGDQIVDYLQGTRKTINATDEATANLVKTFLDEKRTVLEGMGYKTLDDYFPHIFDKTSEDAKRLFKGKSNADISFGNVKARKGDGGDYSKDIVDVLMQYSRGFNRKVYLEPALKPLQDLRTQEAVSQQTADWLGRYIDQLKGIREPSTAEKLFNASVDKALGSKSKGGNHYRTTLGAQRMVSAVATMGMNPGTAIRNMTQVVNTVAGIGAKHAAIGMKDASRALMAGPGSPEWKEMIASGVFDGGVSKNYQADLRAMTNGTSKAANIGQRGAEMFMSMIRGTDVTLRAHAYWGAKALAKSKGMTDSEARNFAINKVVDTQFVTSAADMPTKLNGPGIRSLTQLATFSAKQAEMLTQMGVKTFKKADGSFGINPEHAGNLMSAAVVAGLTTAALKPLIGFNATEWVPFYSNIQPVLDPTKTADAGLYRSPIVTLFAGDGKSKTGLIDAIKTGKMDEFLKDNWSSVVPGGTQLKKTKEGLQTTRSGESKNASGNVKYLQDMGIQDQIKAGLFGQYATNAGQDWIKSGFPTLTDSQMRLGSKDGSGDVTFDQLPREKQKEFYDFYSKANTLTGHNKTVDAIKQAAKDGNANKATRLGAEYNAKVAKTMAAYVRDHPDMPQELQDKLTNELYIDVQKQIDNGLGN